MSHSIKEANILYEQGATYVIMPHFLGGDHTSKIINKNGLSINNFLKEKKEHLAYLKTKEKLGHEHPKVEKDR